MTRQPRTPVTAIFSGAEEALKQAEQRLLDLTPDDLPAALRGIADTTAALAKTVTTLINRTPSALRGLDLDERELVADLLAVRGCFTTALKLAEPALHDLAQFPPPEIPGRRPTSSP